MSCSGPLLTKVLLWRLLLVCSIWQFAEHFHFFIYFHDSLWGQQLLLFFSFPWEETEAQRLICPWWHRESQIQASSLILCSVESSRWMLDLLPSPPPPLCGWRTLQLQPLGTETRRRWPERMSSMCLKPYSQRELLRILPNGRNNK